MYERAAASQMGCSVRELIGMSNCDVNKLKELVNDGVTLCVTGTYQAAEHEKLKKAGYVPLAKYKNHCYGHRGNECVLWGAFGKKSAPELLPGKGTTARRRKVKGVVKLVMETAKARRKH